MKFDGVTLRQAKTWLKAGDPGIKGDVEVLDALAEPKFNVVYVKWVSKAREDRYDAAASSTDPDAVEKLYKAEEKENFSAVWLNDSEDGGVSPAAERMDDEDVKLTLRRIKGMRTTRKAPDTVAVLS
jgi:hypothetical protein